MPRAIALYAAAAVLVVLMFAAASSPLVWLGCACGAIACACFGEDARERRHSRHLVKMARRRRRARRGYVR